jgi:hypothetical protein
MALAKPIESLISVVQRSKFATAAQLDEIRQLDSNIGAECLQRGVCIPEFSMSSSFSAFGTTHIPHFRARSGGAEVSGQADTGYRFFATDGWVQAIKAIGMLEVTDQQSDNRERNTNSEPPPKSKIPGTVNQRMAEILLRDQECVGWSRYKWAQHLGCSESAIQQTETWENIMRLRDATKLRRRD